MNTIESLILKIAEKYTRMSFWKKTVLFFVFILLGFFLLPFTIKVFSMLKIPNEGKVFVALVLFLGAVCFKIWLGSSSCLELYAKILSRKFKK